MGEYSEGYSFFGAVSVPGVGAGNPSLPDRLGAVCRSLAYTSFLDDVRSVNVMALWQVGFLPGVYGTIGASEEHQHVSKHQAVIQFRAGCD